MKTIYRVLIAEDIPSDAILAEREIKKTLKKCIFNTVDTKEEFLKSLDEFKPDIIVSDYKMLNFNGMIALKLALEKCPFIPFIVLTGSMNEDTAVECMKEGATDYVIKEHIKRLGPAILLALEKKQNQIAKAKVIEALKESEEKYKTQFTNAREAILIANAESGIIIDCNEAACALFERTNAELIGKHQNTLHPPDELTGEFSKSFRRHITTDQGRMLNARIITKSGIIKDVEISANLLNIRGGGEIIQGFFNDVTERKRAEEALRESEKRLKDAQALGRIGTWEFDIESQKITWSDQTYKMYERDPTLGPPTVKEENAYYSPEQMQMLRKYVQRAKEEKKDFAYDLEAKLPSGKHIYFLARMQPMQDVQGRVVKLFGTVQDITERKQMEEKLSQERILLRTLIDNIPDNIYVKDKAMRKILANKADLAIVGKPEDEVLGKDDSELFPEEEAAQFMADDRTVIETGQSVLNREEQFVNTQGQSRWLLTSKLALRDQKGSIVGLIGIGHDITKRKQAEVILKERELKLKEQNEEYQKLNQEYLAVNEELTESLERVQKVNEDLKIAKEKAEESDKLKSAFLANMSHEVRTPMNAILGFSGLLTERSISQEKTTEYVRLISSSCQQLLLIINDIIDISKIEADQINLSLETVNPNNLLNELYKIYNLQAEKKGLSLVYLKDQANDIIQIKTDKNRIRQVLDNLLSNAIKFTHNGEIEYGYSVRENFIEFYVSDTGIGIAPENHSLIFERFRQVDSTNTRNYGGNGLGLSIAKALVEKLGGIIKLKSEPGKGTTFFFSIPYDISIKTSVDTTISHKDVACLNLIEKTILVVEDEANNYFYIKEILSDTNVRILHAWNGKEAVDMVKDNPTIDLVLMDIKMPIMDGYEAKRIIKTHNPDLPVLVITAYAMSDEEEKVLKEGFDGYISKPIVSSIFMETIVNHLL